MTKYNIFVKKLITMFCAMLFIIIQPFTIMSESLDQVAKYKAVSIKALKLRETSQLDSRGIASIPAGQEIEIFSIDKDFFYVRYKNAVGYVQSKYFKEFSIIAPNTNVNIPVEENKVVNNDVKSESNDSFTESEAFVERYYAKSNKATSIFSEPSERSRILGNVPKYSEEKIIISQISGDWAFIKYQNITGYIKTESLVQYDFIDPFADPFPGIIKYKYAAVLAKDTPLIDQNNPNKIHKTIPAGSVIGVEAPDNNGMMHVRYMSRRHALIKASDAIELVEVVPYEQAKKGDLISVFTTFFPVHNSNLLTIGRVYNIYFGSNLLNGRIIQPSEKLSMNEGMGPYRMEIGYKKAPIVSKKVDYGYGGGTCQVNTTTYNTLIQVPLLVYYRRVHSRSGAVYAPVGFDAAVGNLASIDMKFENKLSYPVLMQYYISDNVITSLVYRAD